jgi:hypothetical protein
MQERTRILELLAEGRLTVDEAERLLEAVKQEERPAPGPPAPPAPPVPPSPDGTAGTGSKPRFLCILVNKKDGETVNVRVPLGLLRAGLKLKGLLPEAAQAKVDVAMKEKGMHFNINDLDNKSLDEIVQTLQELSIDVNGGDETVRICCE